jgi:hypothetical protein
MTFYDALLEPMPQEARRAAPGGILSGLWLSRQTQALAGRPESARQNCRSELWLRNEIRMVCDEFLTT